MKIAIVQMEMRPACAENADAVVAHLAEACGLGADVAVFPECAITGFHRHVPEQISREFVGESIARIRSRCAALGIAAVVGTPHYPSADSGEIWNAAVVIDERGEVVAICPKVGLTASERRFFTAGATRPTFALGSAECGVMVCREVRDADRLLAEIGIGRMIFWPGVIAWGREATDPENSFTHETASTCARTLASHVVQCNWATSLNDPGLRGLGGSLVIAPTGEVLHECPLDTAGITIIDIDPVVSSR